MVPATVAQTQPATRPAVIHTPNLLRGQPSSTHRPDVVARREQGRHGARETLELVTTCWGLRLSGAVVLADPATSGRTRSLNEWLGGRRLPLGCHVFAPHTCCHGQTQPQNNNRQRRCCAHGSQQVCVWSILVRLWGRSYEVGST